MEPLGRSYAVRGLPAGDRRFPESLQMDGGNVPVGRVSVWVWTWRCHRSYCSTPLRIVPLLLLTNDYCETTIATIDIYHCHNHNDTKDHNHCCCCCCSSYQTNSCDDDGDYSECTKSGHIESPSRHPPLVTNRNRQLRRQRRGR